MANHTAILAPFHNKRCNGQHQHASVCNKELAKAAQYSAKMQSLFVDAVQIAHDLFASNRDPFGDRPYKTFVFVMNARGFDLDDPTLDRLSNGKIVQPPPGGYGCPACADNVDMHSPSHNRNPRQCRWYDKVDYYWECNNCQRNYGNNKPGHMLIPGKCKFANLGSYQTTLVRTNLRQPHQRHNHARRKLQPKLLRAHEHRDQVSVLTLLQVPAVTT